MMCDVTIARTRNGDVVELVEFELRFSVGSPIRLRMSPHHFGLALVGKPRMEAEVVFDEPPKVIVSRQCERCRTVFEFKLPNRVPEPTLCTKCLANSG